MTKSTSLFYRTTLLLVLLCITVVANTQPANRALVVAERAPMRVSAANEADIVTTLERGDLVEILEEDRAAWCRVRWAESEGSYYCITESDGGVGTLHIYDSRTGEPLHSDEYGGAGPR